MGVFSKQKEKQTAAEKTATAPETTTESGVKAEHQVAPPSKPQHPAASLDYGHLAGQSNVGMEGADRDSFALPFLVILQKLSPQLDRTDPEFLGPDAREGDILNTATRKVYSGEEGILVSPVAFKRSYTKWKLREKGVGYQGEYAPSDPIVMTTKPDERNRNVLPDGMSQLVDTRMHGVLLFEETGAQPSLITMASTQIKKSKRWMTQMQEFQKVDNLPTFAHIYKLTTIPEKNDQGNWMGWQIDYVGPVTEQEHIDAAVSFHTALQSGQRKMTGGDPNTVEQ